MDPRRRIIREDWYWPTIEKIAEGRFRNQQTKADILLELSLRSKACCQFFGRDYLICRECFVSQSDASGGKPWSSTGDTEIALARGTSS